MSTVRRLSDRLLTVVAVLGGLALVATLIGFAAGVRPVFLRSGSMAPTLTTSTLVLVEEVTASQVRVGDIVCVRTAGGARVTHRVVGLERDGDTAELTLKGDANTAADSERYRVASAYRVVGHLPWLGRLVALVTHPVGLGLLGCLVTILLLLLGRGDRGAGPGPPGRKHRRRRRHVAQRPVLVTAGAVLAVLGPGQVAGAWAAPWTNAVSITGTTFTAGTIAVPATFTCGGLGVLSVQFNWAAVAGATSYTLHYGAGGASTTTVAGTSATITSAISGGTSWVRANRNFGSTTWTSAASNTRTYTVAVVSLCG